MAKGRGRKAAEKGAGQNPGWRNQKDRDDLLQIPDGHNPLGLGAHDGVRFPATPFPIFHELGAAHIAACSRIDADDFSFFDEQGDLNGLSCFKPRGFLNVICAVTSNAFG